jgi:hypothetical protein
MTRSAWKPPTPSQLAREDLIDLFHRSGGKPPGFRKLWSILAGIVDGHRHPTTEQDVEWFVAGTCDALRGEDPARAFELKWPRRGRPTNASRARRSIELEKAVSIARYIESDPNPKAHGATERAIGATAKDYRCGRDGLRKIWLERRQEAIDAMRRKVSFTRARKPELGRNYMDALASAHGHESNKANNRAGKKIK